ncbi:hypothetical protein TrVE_jg1044 [Triparma verrucosa]|uniref:AAA+ ATPase domain-containing protein n=1 Tax=Triparma verrucosa TaxID=1606542 RepID=A0A9W7B3R0_9STRA|nr:hypothetical protein TrVE_jg1044 [Triparma verrucosa]
MRRRRSSSRFVALAVFFALAAILRKRNRRQKLLPTIVDADLSSFLSTLSAASSYVIEPNGMTIQGSNNRRYNYEPSLLPLLVREMSRVGAQFSIRRGNPGSGLATFLQQLVIVSMPLVFMNYMLGKLDPTKDETDSIARIEPLHLSPEFSTSSFGELCDTYPSAAVRSMRIIHDYIVSGGEADSTLASLPNGVMFSGTPGSGKTYMHGILVRGLKDFYARSSEPRVGSVGVRVNGSDFIYKYVGVGSARIKNLYKAVEERCKREIENNFGMKECVGIVAIDEVDSFTFQRSSERSDTTHNSEQHHTLNMFLSLLDFTNESEGVRIITIATTNMIGGLDAAVRRYGRFDDIVHLMPPSLEERVAILKEVAGGGEGDCDWLEVAAEMSGWSRVEVSKGVSRDERQRVEMRRGMGM